MNRWHPTGPPACAVLALLGTQTALPETVPVRGVVDSRVRTAMYDSDEVYRIQGYVGFEIDLQFEAGESFVGIGSGDIEALSFVSQDNHLFIKPKATKVSTNLTVLTTRRPYQILYTASNVRPKSGDPDVIFAVRFTYPPSRGGAVSDRLGRMLEQTHPQNTDYWYCGSPSIMPVAASDDGIHTRLRFAAKSEQPAIFALNEDGSESLLNFSMEGDDVVIHRVARQLIVRRGKLAGRIVNKGFSGSGHRLHSGTVSPGVKRVEGAQRP